MTILMLIIISLLTVVFGIAIFNVLTGPMLGHTFSLVETPLVFKIEDGNKTKTNQKPWETM